MTAPGQSRRPRLLEIRDLTVGYRVGQEKLEALRNVSLQIAAGEVYGLVGESGSGKSTLALAIMRYLPSGGEVQQGSIRFDGHDLLGLSRQELCAIWGSQISLVPQDPLSSLNPSLRIGEQMGELLRHHLGLSARQAQDRSREQLEMVHIADPDRVLQSYPHQLSGGMQQRVMIAMALSTEPKLLVLDEPTTNLDATTQATVLDLIREVMSERRTAALYVTHNLGVVAQICDRLAVLYSGELVEDGTKAEIFARPLHPYTRGLLDSVPRLGENKAEVKLRPIEGRIPELGDLPAGCVFRPRCPIAVEICMEYPPLYRPDESRCTRCHRWEEILSGKVSPKQPKPELDELPQVEADGDQVMEADGVKVYFARSRSWAAALTGRRPQMVRAVDGVDVEIERGRTLGLVGESGSGKTTLARAIIGLTPRSAGSLSLFEKPQPERLQDRDREARRHIQIVFQNPQEALNPYLTVGESLRRPLERLLGLSRTAADETVSRLLEDVHLSADYAERLPGQLSGGEKQRVAIARAFASNPALLLADEPVSSLDVSVQASILNLLNELQAEHGSAYLFISHDLAVVGYLADVVAVIYLGRLMEVADAEDLFEPPYHPYTEALLSAIPLLDPNAEQERIRLEGEVPSPVDVPRGCPFHTRCPHFLGDICAQQEPPWQTLTSGKRYYCHIPPDDLERAQRRAFRLQRLNGD